MRIALVAHAYPPAPASGARRAAHVARVLVEAGLEVRVITASPGRSAGSRERPPPDRLPAERAVPSGPEVIEVRPLPSGADLLAALGRAMAALRGGRGKNGHPSTAALSGSAAAATDLMDPGPRLRRWITAVLRFPNGDLGFLAPAVRAALDPGAARPDAVYTTGPPITSHLVGLAVHALGGVPWIAEYRDPWTVEGVPLRPPHLRSAATDALERWLERRGLAAAAEVVAVSEGIASELAPVRRALGRPEPRLARNGIPELLPAAEPPSGEGPLRLLHLGNLYGFRDPTPLLAALADLCEERGWGPADLRVDFVGDTPRPGVRALAERSSAGRLVRFHEWVDHATGQALLREADVLVLLAQRQPLQVPNKLYEYLGVRKPILAFADRDGETARMLERAGGHAVVGPEDPPAAVREAVARCLDAAGRRLPLSDEVLRGWTTERQLASLPALVRGAAGRS